MYNRIPIFFYRKLLRFIKYLKKITVYLVITIIEEDDIKHYNK